MTKFLLSSLAVGDLIFGSCFFTRGIALLVFPPDEIFCRFLIAPMLATMMTSFGTAAIMSVHCYVTLKTPGTDLGDKNKTKVVISEGIKWMFSVGVGKE